MEIDCVSQFHFVADSILSIACMWTSEYCLSWTDKLEKVVAYDMGYVVFLHFWKKKKEIIFCYPVQRLQKRKRELFRRFSWNRLSKHVLYTRLGTLIWLIHLVWIAGSALTIELCLRHGPRWWNVNQYRTTFLSNLFLSFLPFQKQNYNMFLLNISWNDGIFPCSKTHSSAHITV